MILKYTLHTSMFVAVLLNRMALPEKKIAADVSVIASLDSYTESDKIN